MNLRTRAAAYGAAGLALAGLLVLSGTGLGLFTGDFNPTAPGSLSILLTDPPNIPAGVSSVYIVYSDLAVHATGLGDAGWIATGGQGTIETLGLVNLSQTISSANVPTGRYNAFAFTISSASVDFQGTNYTATVNNGRLIVPLVGGLIVNSSDPAALVLDIQPTVLNLGNQTNPDFVITTGARAFQIPSGEVSEQMRHLGFQLSLDRRPWFRSFVTNHPDNLTLSAVYLSANSFSFSAANPSSDPVTLKMVIIAAQPPSARPSAALASLPSSVVFTIAPDGSLTLLTYTMGAGGPQGQVRAALAAAGYQLPGGASGNFTFSGTIKTLLARSGITNGTSYYIVVLGSHALAVETVQAT